MYNHVFALKPNQNNNHEMIHRKEAIDKPDFLLYHRRMQNRQCYLFHIANPLSTSVLVFVFTAGSIDF